MLITYQTYILAERSQPHKSRIFEFMHTKTNLKLVSAYINPIYHEFPMSGTRKLNDIKLKDNLNLYSLLLLGGYV